MFVKSDLLPYFRSSISLVKSVLRGEDGHEEAFYGATDCVDAVYLIRMDQRLSVVNARLRHQRFESWLIVQFFKGRVA